ncbi:hypothetical protein [Salinibacillus xinjiangensis]|uniref:Uncharacterized protein n=1 Tax=Salinibacillus xinjiangensis TaxID=1229268 RepID=A0A6G1X207_9BACI|nr:hypothetical protein [Salinibacillus xinjiangensis]MRG85021.1 hypothetical protein [Salinibacillus xinjiangensis]
MKNMGKWKRVLLGTSLAAAIFAIAGYGSFALFSGTEEVEGEIDHLVVELSSNVEEIDYDVDVGEGELLAPGRTAMGEWVTLETNLSEMANFNLGYELQLLKDNEPVMDESVSLESYRSAAVLTLGDDEFYVPLECADVLRRYLVNPNDPPTDDYGRIIHKGDAQIALANQDNLNRLLRDLTVGEIDAILFPDTIFFPDTRLFPDSSFMTANFFPDDYFNEGDVETPVLFPDSTFHLQEGQQVNFLFGTHLKREAGNEYQGLTLDTKFNFGVGQMTERPM